MPNSPARPSYQHHAGFYRSINPGHDLSKPWESSPESCRDLPMSPFTPVFELPRPGRNITDNSFSSTSTVVSIPPPQKKGLWRRILKFITSDKSSEKGIPVMHLARAFAPQNPYSEKVPLREWKQYGYWARPFINDVLCQNSPVTSEKSITTEALADLITNMRGANDPDFDVFPENWIIGAKHRALPPRPARWKDPDPDLPLPFPWEVQLNPLLHHLLWGPSPLRWCIWNDPYNHVRYGRTAVNVYCTDADRAQPATWPFLTCMHFNAVQGDDAYHFPWQFTVYNPKGVKVGDLLAEIHYNFSKAVSDAEFSSWPRYRQEAARRTRQQRVDLWVDRGVAHTSDFMRRWDALGAQMWFRGIEPSVDGEGWMIVFGPY